MSCQEPSRSRNRPPPPIPKKTRVRQSGSAGTRRQRRVAVYSSEARPRSAARARSLPYVRSVSRCSPDLRSPRRPVLMSSESRAWLRPTASAIHWQASAAARWASSAAREAGGHGDEDERGLVVAEAGGEQGVAAGFAAVAGGVASYGCGPQGAGAVAGAVEDGVGDQFGELAGAGDGQGGGFGLVGRRSAADEPGGPGAGHGHLDGEVGARADVRVSVGRRHRHPDGGCLDRRGDRGRRRGRRCREGARSRFGCFPGRPVGQDGRRRRPGVLRLQVRLQVRVWVRARRARGGAGRRGEVVVECVTRDRRGRVRRRLVVELVPPVVPLLSHALIVHRARRPKTDIRKTVAANE